MSNDEYTEPRAASTIIDLCSHLLITHRTPHNAELFCEIRMMCTSANVVAQSPTDTCDLKAFIEIADAI
jgi:hypothetical protein